MFEQMKNLLYIFSVVFTVVITNAQTPINQNINTNTQLFPEKCVGSWSGMMKIYYQGQLRDSVEVIFTVSPLEKNSWRWKTEYISDKMPVTKDYVLKVEDNKINTFLLDEGEGLELFDYAFGNKLYSFFETEGLLLSSSYELIGDQLIFEVTSGKKIENTTSEIKSFTVDVVQRVVFKRIE